MHWLEFVWVFDGKTIWTFLEASGPLSPLFNGLACYRVYLGRIGLDGQLNPNSAFTILGLVSTLGMLSNLVPFKGSLGWFGLGLDCQFYCREGWVGLILVLSRTQIFYDWVMQFNWINLKLNSFLSFNSNIIVYNFSNPRSAYF